MGDGFSVDPDTLHSEADKRLGILIDHVNDAYEKIDAAAQYSPFHGGGDVFDSIGEYWHDALHYLKRVLKDNARNIELDRRALKAIADRYEEIETETAREVNRW